MAGFDPKPPLALMSDFDPLRTLAERANARDREAAPGFSSWLWRVGDVRLLGPTSKQWRDGGSPFQG